jgi:hypothetical protein
MHIFVNRKEGTLQFKITKLSSYKQVDDEVISPNVLFLNNLPFKICVQFVINEEYKDIDIGIYLDTFLINKIYKTQ